MSIQDVFYLLGTIYLGIGIIVSIGIIVLIAYIAQVVAGIRKRVNENLDRIKDTVENVGEAAQEVTVSPLTRIGGLGGIIWQVLRYGMGRVFQ